MGDNENAASYLYSSSLPYPLSHEDQGSYVYPDSDQDRGGDLHADRHANPSSLPNPYPNLDRANDPHADQHADLNRNRGSYSHPDQHADLDRDWGSHSYANQHADLDRDWGSHSYADQHVDAYGIRNGHLYLYSDGNADVDLGDDSVHGDVNRDRNADDDVDGHRDIVVRWRRRRWDEQHRNAERHEHGNIWRCGCGYVYRDRGGRRGNCHRVSDRSRPGRDGNAERDRHGGLRSLRSRWAAASRNAAGDSAGEWPGRPGRRRSITAASAAALSVPG